MFYKILIFCLFPVLIKAQGTFKTTAGIDLHVGAVITLENMHLENDGVIDGRFRFTGNVTTHIGGSNITQFEVIEIAKTGTAALRLNRSIGINSSIDLISGLLDLNGNNILLQPAALLNGEKESSHITGLGGGFVEITQNLVAPTAVNPGNLGLIISSSANPGVTTIRRGHQSQTNSSGTGNSIFRYYDVMPSNNTALNATLRIQYLDAELNGLAESLLTLCKRQTAWTSHGFASRDAAINFVEQTGINDLSRFTLSSPNNALPLEWGLFHIECPNTIKWETLQEINTASFTVQGSLDGINWVDKGVVRAAGQASTYSYTDQLPSSFYRIVQYDMDGSKSYSSVLHNRCHEKDVFTVYPNPVVDNTLYVMLSGNATLQLYNSAGVLIKQQVARPGVNQLVMELPAGVYMLVAKWADGRKKVLKLMK